MVPEASNIWKTKDKSFTVLRTFTSSVASPNFGRAKCFEFKRATALGLGRRLSKYKNTRCARNVEVRHIWAPLDTPMLFTKKYGNKPSSTKCLTDSRAISWLSAFDYVAFHFKIEAAKIKLIQLGVRKFHHRSAALLTWLCLMLVYALR